MIVNAPAKINWSLRITGRRADGYHELETLFQTISLHDTLTFVPSEGVTLACDDPSIPTDEANLVFRSVRALGVSDLAIDLRKEIPSGGGLGGGSSDAAATLRALDLMFKLRRDDLPRIALSLGSDVPFFLQGGTAYATGRGEVLQPMPSLARVPLLLVLPEERVLTKDAFARVTRYSAPLGAEHYRQMTAQRDFTSFTNDFEDVVFATLPHLDEYRERLVRAGAKLARMSGSGSTLFGAFETPLDRDRAMREFEDVRTVACETV